MSILIAGATGLVGREAASLLVGKGLSIIGRRPVEGLACAQLVDSVETWPRLVADAKPDIAISALGTTIRQAGSQAAFRAVDYELVLRVATAAKEAGARQFVMVSSVGASARSSNFYLRTKGEAEDAAKAIGFERVDILRPGLLRGNRSGPARFGESIAMAFSPITDLLTPNVLSQYRSIAALDVARAIAVLAETAGDGVHIHHNSEMLALARTMG